jgi:Flp pilus assembly protein TadD
MRTKLLLQLVQVPADLDYVQHFQTLSAVNLEIRKSGASAERLLRKAILESDVGNFEAALLAAKDAVDLEPKNPEAHHQVGMASLMLAMVKSGALASGPGLHEMPTESATELVLAAMEAFREAAKLNPEDQESRADLAALKVLVKRKESEEELAQALRDGTLN